MIENLLKRYPSLAPLRENLYNAKNMLLTSVRAGGKFLICGNGGSAADAEHIVGELMKGFLLPRSLPAIQREKFITAFPTEAETIISNLQCAIPALALSSGVSLPTAFANDVSAEFGFAQQVLALGKPEDILWAISTSGNSKNLVRALQVARACGIKTLGLTGGTGGNMVNLCDVEIRVPALLTPEIQELHLPVYHALCAELERELFS